MWRKWECAWSPEWGPKESRENGGKDWCVEEASVDKVEWEDKVEKVEKQECSVEVARK